MKGKIALGIGAVFLLIGCGTSPSLPKKGVIVNVVELSKNRPGSLQCNDKNFAMSYVYVGPDTVKGAVSKNEKWLIATYAKAALKETSYITPVTIKYEPGYDDKMYPIMTINVIKNSIFKRKTANMVEKYGIFTAQIDIKVPGSGVVCNSSEPVTVTVKYTEPIYKENFLPSDEEIEEYLVKTAIKEAVSSFVPTTRTILRPVMFSGSEVVKKSAEMLNADNCEMAKDLLENYVKTHKDANAYYNLGVSYECLAKSKDITEVKPYLKKALKYYTKAVELEPSNYYFNQARKEIKDELRVLNVVKRKSKEVKERIKSFN